MSNASCVGSPLYKGMRNVCVSLLPRNPANRASYKPVWFRIKRQRACLRCRQAWMVIIARLLNNNKSIEMNIHEVMKL